MKKLLKISGIVFLALILLLTLFYFYVTNNSERLIKNIVAKQSGGLYSLEMKKIKFDLWDLRLAIDEPHFSGNDSLHQFTTYDVRIKSLVLDLAALRPLIFEGKFFVDTLIIMQPKFTATKWKDKPEEKFSLTQQMGKVYSSLNKVLQTLNIHYCVLDSGHLTLIDKVNRENKPVSITDFYIRIDNFKGDEKKDSINRYLFTDRIKFYSSHQNITAPDGRHGIKYSRLRINSFRQSIEIDSCYIYGKQPDGGFSEFGVFFDTLKLSNVDFNKLTNEKLVRADSAFCLNPVISIHTELKANKPTKSKAPRYESRDSMEMAFKALFGDIDVHYIGVLNAKFDMQTRSNDKITSYSSRKNDFVLKDIVIVNKPEIPVSFGSLYFGMNAYTTYIADSNYAIKLDSIILHDRTINIANFTISPTAKNRDLSNRKNLKMQALEIEGISWLDLIFNRKLVANEVSLVRPEITANLQGKRVVDKPVKNTPIYTVLHKMLSKIDFRTLKIKDANLEVYSSNNTHYSLEKVNAEIRADQILYSNNFNEFTSAVTAFSFSGGKLIVGGNIITLGHGTLNGKTRYLLVSEASITNNKKSTYATLKDFGIENFSESSPNHLNIGRLSWSRGDFTISPENPEHPNSSSQKPKGTLHLSIDQLDGRNTAIYIKSKKLSAELLTDNIMLTKAVWKPGQKPTIENFSIKGKLLRLNNPGLNISAQQFLIAQRQPSFFNELKIHSAGTKDTIIVNSPRLSFSPDINSFISGRPVISDVVINNPEIRINSNGDTTKKDAVVRHNSKLPSININHLDILNPVVLNLPPSVSNTFDASEHTSRWYFSNISTDSNHVTVGGMKASIQGFTAVTKKMNVSVKGEGKLNLDIGAIRFYPSTENSAASWSANMNEVSADDIALTTRRNDTLNNNIILQSFHAQNVSLRSGDKITINELLKNNGRFIISKGNVSISSNTSQMMVGGLEYDHSNRKLSFDTFNIKPVMDRESFMKTKTWQTDYLQFNTGKTEIWGLDHELFFLDSIIYARKINSRNAKLSVYKDKRLPFDFSKIKQLPTSMIQNISKKIKIDSIRLNNTDITYEEFNDKTKKNGTVHFNRTEILLEGVKNFNINTTDSLKVSATTWLMDSAYIRLRFNESYTDTLHAFLFAVRLSPFNLSALNPMLEPLVSAKIISGKVDTIRMNAIGREYVARGKMQMYYHDLKAQYLNTDDNNVKTLKTRLINFAANDLILHHKNTHGYGEVYAERVRERSIINYWLKMAISGMVSSTGVKSNKKQAKKYRKSIKKLNVPEIPDVSL